MRILCSSSSSILHSCFCCPCRHVVLPQEIAKCLPKGVLLSEVGFSPGSCQLYRALAAATEKVGTPQNEWRQLGVQQSRGWVHYAIHRPEPHIMLFR